MKIQPFMQKWLNENKSTINAKVKREHFNVS